MKEKIFDRTQMVHSLWHYELDKERYPDEDGDEERVKFIGTFSSKEKAEQAIDRLRPCPGFRDWPKGFWIDSYYLDGVGWQGGFFNPWEETASGDDNPVAASDE